MHLTLGWTNVLTVVSPSIALVSLFFACRSNRIARKSLDLAHKTGQATYEAVKASSIPAVGLFLTEIEYRRANERELGDFIFDSEMQNWAREVKADSLEVVVRGRLVNNLPHEVLVTCRDHPDSGRKVWYELRNQSVFFIGATKVELGWMVLSKGQEVSFEWIDRRPRNDWIDIYNLHNKNFYNDPELRLPRLTWYDIVGALWRRESFYWARRRKVNRSGFLLVCESRVTERVTTVWRAEVIKPPIETGGRDEDGRIFFNEVIETLPGPLDDSVFFYRVGFDSTLALIKSPKTRTVAGRA